MRGGGLRERAGYRAGDYDRVGAVGRLKRDTRHFAKRQLTWFRKGPEVAWLSIGERESSEEVAARILERVTRFLSHLAAQSAPETVVGKLAAAASVGGSRACVVVCSVSQGMGRRKARAQTGI